MKMNYCMECGAPLRLMPHEDEGDVPWCDVCGEFRYPVFNTAVSLVVTDEGGERFLLIRQYGRPHNILVAGYVNRGEDAEDAVRRELREEMGLEALSLRFNRSRFFPPSNTLMLNFTVTVSSSAEPHANHEVDAWQWFSPDEARRAVKPHSFASAFLLGWLDGVYDFPAFPAHETKPLIAAPCGA